jgi:co-chaperonin GroES (HSP10)
MKKPTVHVTGSNVLVEVLSHEEVSSGGIIMASQGKAEDALIKAVVKNKGPGFLLPFPKTSDDEVTALIGQETSFHIVPLDVEIGDVVYFPKAAMESVVVEGKQYTVVPYQAIKIYVRDEGQ